MVIKLEEKDNVSNNSNDGFIASDDDYDFSCDDSSDDCDDSPDDCDDSSDDNDASYNYDPDKFCRQYEIKRRRTFTKRQEIASLILLLCSTTLIIFVAFEVLSLGILGIVILGTTTFVLLSHFMGTYILTYDYYRGDGDNIFESVSLIQRESTTNSFMCLLKFKILPIIFLCLGIILVTLGSTGIIGLGLGLGLGIPSIVVDIFPFMHFIIKANSNDESRYYTERCCRKWWKIIICTMGCTLGLATTITLFALCVTRTLTWTLAFPTALFASVLAVILSSCVMSNNLLEFRTILEEISNIAMFFGGISINILISFGIFPFGSLGIGICAMFIFIGASRFIFTNTLTASHNVGFQYDKQLAEYGDKDEICKFSNGIINSGTTNHRMLVMKRMIFPIVAIFTGIGIICKIGFFGFELSLGIGIPLLALTLPYITWLITKAIKLRVYADCSSNYWVISVGIIGFITAITFPILSITGVLAWQSAIAFGAPTVIFATLTVLFNLGISLFKNKYDSIEDSLKDSLKKTTGNNSKSLGIKSKSHGIKLIYNGPLMKNYEEEKK